VDKPDNAKQEAWRLPGASMLSRSMAQLDVPKAGAATGDSLTDGEVLAMENVEKTLAEQSEEAADVGDADGTAAEPEKTEVAVRSPAELDGESVEGL